MFIVRIEAKIYNYKNLHLADVHITLWDDKLSMSTYAYPHKPLKDET